MDISLNRVKEYLLVTHKAELKVFIVYLAISLVMLWQVAINMFGYVVNGYGDVYQSLFNLWWVPYSIFTLHQSPYFTNLLFYPIGANLVTQTMTPLAGIFSWPLQLVSRAFAYNSLFFSSFALSGLFMFVLANYFVKNKYAAFIAGLIYAFSPMHIAQSYGHLDWTIIEWIPLFLYFYVRTLDSRKVRYALLAAASFVLLSFMGDIEQGIMVFFATAVFTILYWLFHTPETGRHPKLLNHKQLSGMHFLSMSSISYKSLAGIGLIVLFTFILSLPFIIGILGHLSSSTLSTAAANSGLAQNMLWSDNLASFFLPSYYNGIFNSLSQSYKTQIYGLVYQGAQYQLDIGEKVSYIGYSVLLLVLLSLYYDFKQSRMKHTFLWLIFLLVFAWLSLGPYLQIYSSVTNIPTLYSVYRAIPILNIIREPGRFDLVVTICLGMLAAFGFNELTMGKDRKTKYTYLAIVAAVILIEYNGMHHSLSFANSLITPTQMPAAYNQLSQVRGNFSVLMLPAIANNSNAPAQYIGMETYYVSALKKPIIGGYTSRENTTQSLLVSSIPLVAAASYLEEGYGLIFPSPINENFSNVTMLFLSNYNVGFISVLRPAYNLTSQEELYSYLASTYGQPVFESNDTFVFSTSQAVSKYAGKSLAAYTVGTDWIPGYEFCSSISSCNANISSMWWGNNTRAMILYSPASENVRMTMIATAPVNGTALGIYLNGNPVQAVRLRSQQYQYAVNFTAPQGFNEIAFYTPYNSSQVGQYFSYGIRNITFTR